MIKSGFLLLSLLMFLNLIPLSAQQFVANYDEAKVPAYTLPNPLVFNNVDKVQNKKDWDRRRTEILEIFENEVYGISPVWKGDIIPTELTSNLNARTGSAKILINTTKRKNCCQLTSMNCFHYLHHDHYTRPVLKMICGPIPKGSSFLVLEYRQFMFCWER
jgi:hypothetical protein